MAIEDVQAFLVTGFIAAVIALPVAALARRSSSPYHVTVVWSFGIAIVSGPGVCGIAEAVDQAIAAGGIPFGRALEVIFSVAFVLYFAAPLFFGLPAVLVGCAVQWLIASNRSKPSDGKVTELAIRPTRQVSAKFA